MTYSVPKVVAYFSLERSAFDYYYSSFIMKLFYSGSIYETYMKPGFLSHTLND